MADRLEDLLRACTVRVLGGPAPGAGFFVAPGHVLTCAHVTGEDDPAHGNSVPLVVRWERDGHDPAEIPVTEPALVLPSQGRPIPALAADYPDIAVLRVSGLGTHPCVLLDDGWPEPEDGFQVFGYPSEGGTVVLTPARLTYRGPHGTAPMVFFDLGSDTIKPGMSGAALLNLRTGAACGIVTATKHQDRPDGALAVPWSQIAADLSDIAAANRAFHDADRRWVQARRLTASRPPGPVPPPDADGAVPTGKPAHAEVVIEATLANGTLESATWMAGSQVCRHSAPLPAEVASVWSASAQPELLAGERLAIAGRRLTTALLDDNAERLLAGLITRLRPGDSAEVTFSLADDVLSLPTELMRLSAGPGADTGPLALLPAVSVCRRIRLSASLDDRPALGAGPPAGTAGPLKILAAVAAPDETKTRNVPLDTEAEMQAVIEAITSATCQSATTSWVTWPGPWATHPPPAPTTRPASTSPPGSQRRTRPTRAGSATCQSATSDWVTWPWPWATRPPPAPTTRPASTSPPGSRPGTRPTRGWQRDLSVSHDKLGDLARVEGDLPAARAHYQASLDIRARLAAADPTNTHWQRDLAFVKQRLDELASE